MTEERNREKSEEKQTKSRENDPGQYASKDEVSKEEETGGALPDSASDKGSEEPK